MSDIEPNIKTESTMLPAKVDEVLPDKLCVLPVVDRPFFPVQNLPISVSAEWETTLKEISKKPPHMMGVCLTRNREKKPTSHNDLHSFGTVVRVHQITQHENWFQVIALGIQYFRIHTWIQRTPIFQIVPEYIEPVTKDNEKIKAYTAAIMNALRELLGYNPLYRQQFGEFLSRFGTQRAHLLGDFAAVMTNADRDALQAVLEEQNLEERLDKVLLLLHKELEVARVQADIEKQVQGRLNEKQKEYFLKEQLRVIQKELGFEKDDKTVDLESLKQRLAKLTLTEEATKRTEEEIKKMKVLEIGSPEYAVTRNYLDTISSLPWSICSKDSFDLAAARRILDRGHAGLSDIKERIIEFLAIGANKGEMSGAMLLLVGPPGVGKTSIGQGIAKALGRKFYNLSLGGMRDEAEIKGHRKTYIGAMPGKIIKTLIQCSVSNPVIMLDEIDKLGISFQGDPASALLEVLDPEQNQSFLDHYLDLRFDLSKVLFIGTANQLDSIPAPLLDRLEMIRLSGYLNEEKAEIARRHLWPKLLVKAGVSPRQISITHGALRMVIDGYAREAGVRSLEKKLGSIVRKGVVELLEKKPRKIQVSRQSVTHYLGQPIFRVGRVRTTVGVVIGLAWTAQGGVTLDVEAALVHRKRRSLQLTGRLGDVMRESAEIAFSYIAGNLAQFSVKPDFYDNATVHLHVPEGATPKDGPSAGITIASSLLSLALGKRVRRSVAMTGELTLVGKVLPIGGIREKVIAVRRVKLKELILPQDNQHDWEELPHYLRKDIKVHFVGAYPEIARILFAC